jgi:hypothetical protein
MTPKKIRVREYNVGFGDCFLLTFSYPDNTDRHVLIDFGSTKKAAKGPASMKVIADKIAADCGGKLHMVAVTHRHADHISGFAGAPGKVIHGLNPDIVVQPWTEDPKLDPNAEAPAGAAGSGAGGAGAAARRVVARLGDMNAVARRIGAQGLALEAAGSTPPKTVEEIRFLGDTNIKNPDAVRGLMALSGKHVYASFGTQLPIATILPGVSVEVLGPPTLKQAPDIANLASTNAAEYWHLASRVALRTQSGTTSPLFPGAATIPLPPMAARWLVPKIDAMNGEELLSIVRSIDDALNNTSLILLFDIAGSKMLFPGDAQIENWSYALFNAPQAAAIRARLADTAVYKVGHHGSLNATPKTLWNGFTRRQELPPFKGRLISVISTLSGKHGKVSRNTEVPRRKLMDELEAKSDVVNTQRLGIKTFWRDAELEIPSG